MLEFPPQEQNKKRAVEVICAERPELAEEAQKRAEQAFAILDIEVADAPKVEVIFEESTDQPNLGKVRVTPEQKQVVFDQRLSTEQGEAELIASMKDTDYPGTEQTLTHEVGHITLWNVTGMERQAVTRLLDEGWASLIENLGNEEATLSNVIVNIKARVLEGLKEETDNYERCFDFSKPIDPDEDLNSSEYKVGQALLLWIHENYGKDKLIDLLKKAPAIERRNDALPEGDFEPAMVDQGIHQKATEYDALLAKAQSGSLPPEELLTLAKKWEGEQFEVALKEITGNSDIKKVKQDFKEWLNA